MRWEILNLLVEGRGEGFAYVWCACISEFSYVYLPSLNCKHLEEPYSSHHLAHSIIVEELMLNLRTVYNLLSQYY